MPETFLHGVEVLEIDSGPRPIRTVNSSVIGVVGYGEDDAIPASVILGAGAAGIRFVHRVTDGIAEIGNEYTVRIIKPATNNATLATTIIGKAITISLATDASSINTTTVSQLITHFNGSGGSAANTFVVAELPAGSSGTEKAPVAGPTALSGGVDGTFPLNKPVLITSASAAAKAGAGTYLGKALAAIYKQAGAVCVVVRTDPEGDGVAGDIATMTGIHALRRAQSDLGVTPRIIIAEGADAPEVIDDFKSVLASLRAIGFVGISTAETATEAVEWVNDNGNDRTMSLWPFVNGGEDPAPLAAGSLAKSDNDRGFWWSPSNQEIFGIESLDAPVDFQLGDPASLANVLNAGNVTTFIREGGFRLWGNRSGSTDAKWAFLCVRRTADIINDSVKRAHLWAVDRPITKTYLSDVTESVNAYLRTLKNIGAILDGKCWPDPDLNTPANVAQGKVYFNFDFGPTYPAEHVTFQSLLENNYITDLI